MSADARSWIDAIADWCSFEWANWIRWMALEWVKLALLDPDWLLPGYTTYLPCAAAVVAVAAAVVDVVASADCCCLCFAAAVAVVVAGQLMPSSLVISWMEVWCWSSLHQSHQNHTRLWSLPCHEPAKITMKFDLKVLVN